MDKRDAILKAATKVFAQNGYFQSQVADVARVAGVAAGTVYLYFKSKDDLLVSIFERSMHEVLADHIEQGWIQPMGRRRAPGKPVTWGSTPYFLEHFGLAALEDLPGFDEYKKRIHASKGFDAMCAAAKSWFLGRP